MTVSLEKYRVPAEPFLRLVQKYTDEQEMTLEILSEAWGFERSFLRKQEYKTILEFDTADLMVTRTYGPMLWQREPFKTLYWQGEIPPDTSKPERCARRNCDNWFALRGHDNRANHQLYCSDSCNTMESRYRNKKTRPREAYCRNGHPRTPETSFTGTKGERTCAICRREWNRKRLQRETPEQRSARLDYFREYHKKRKATA